MKAKLLLSATAGIVVVVLVVLHARDRAEANRLEEARRRRAEEVKVLLLGEWLPRSVRFSFEDMSDHRGPSPHESIGESDRPHLERALAEGDARLQRNALRALLGLLGTRGIVEFPRIIDLLADPDEKVRVEVAKDLFDMVGLPHKFLRGDHGEVESLELAQPVFRSRHEFLRSLLKSAEAPIRACAARLLSHCGVAAAVAADDLVVVVDGPDASTAVPAAIALAYVAPSDPRTGAALQRALARATESDRYGVIQAMGQLGIRAVSLAEQLLPIVEAGGPESDRAITTLLEAGPEGRKALLPVLVRWLEDPARMGLAARTLSIMAPESLQAIPALAAAFEKARGEDLVDFARCAGQLGPAAAPLVPALIRMLGTEREGTAVFALGDIGAPAREAVPQLVEILKQATDIQRRWAVLECLAGIGPDAAEAVPVLLQTLKSEEGTERSRAITALGKIGESARAAVPFLMERAREPASRYWAVDALGQIGAAAEPAIPLLRELAEKESDRQAADALEKIEAALREAGRR